MNFDKEFDASGLSCPLPIVKTKKALADIYRKAAMPYLEQQAAVRESGGEAQTKRVQDSAMWLAQNLDTVMQWLKRIAEVGLAVLIYRLIPALIAPVVVWLLAQGRMPTFARIPGGNLLAIGLMGLLLLTAAVGVYGVILLLTRSTEARRLEAAFSAYFEARGRFRLDPEGRSAGHTHWLDGDQAPATGEWQLAQVLIDAAGQLMDEDELVLGAG